MKWDYLVVSSFGLDWREKIVSTSFEGGRTKELIS